MRGVQGRKKGAWLQQKNKCKEQENRKRKGMNWPNTKRKKCGREIERKKQRQEGRKGCREAGGRQWLTARADKSSTPNKDRS